MTTRIYRTALLSLLVITLSACAGSKNKEIQQDTRLTPIPATKAVNDPSNSIFMNAIANYVAAKKAPNNSRYEFTRIDLNGDGRREGIVLMKSPHKYWCEEYGCYMAVFEAHNSGFTLLSEITPVPGRMQAVNATQPCVLVDYAHTPDGLEKALTAARDHFDGQLWCVVGCGGNRDAGKRPQMAAIAESIADHIIFTSDNPRFEEPQAILADMLQGISNQDAVQIQVDRARAIAMAIEQAGNQDVVLIAGKGHESWQEIRGEKIPMDDCLLAQAALQQRGAA